MIACITKARTLVSMTNIEGGNIEQEPIRLKYIAAVGNAVEHGAMIKSHNEKVAGWLADQDRLQKRFDVLKGGINFGTTTAPERDTVEMDIALRNANKNELGVIRDEFVHLAEKIEEHGGKSKELVEDNDSLDFTAPGTLQ